MFLLLLLALLFFSLHDALYLFADAGSAMFYFPGPAQPMVPGPMFFPFVDPVLHGKILNQINYYFRFFISLIYNFFCNLLLPGGRYTELTVSLFAILQ